MLRVRKDFRDEIYVVIKKDGRRVQRRSFGNMTKDFKDMSKVTEAGTYTIHISKSVLWSGTMEFEYDGTSDLNLIVSINKELPVFKRYFSNRKEFYIINAE